MLSWTKSDAKSNLSLQTEREKIKEDRMKCFAELVHGCSHLEWQKNAWITRKVIVVITNLQATVWQLLTTQKECYKRYVTV